MLEFHECAAIFPLLPEAELLDLAADIEANGLIEPIVLCDGKILDGRNRYLACIEAKVEPHYEAWRGDDPLAYVVSKNLKRRHLNESQRGAAASKAATMRQGERTDLLSIDKRLSLDEAAKLFNVSVPTISRIRAIEREAPDLIPAIESGELTAHRAYGQMRRHEAAKIKAELPLPTGQYRCIVIDPPWPIEKIEREVRPQQQREVDYATMTLEEIAALPIPALAFGDGCHIYLWTTHKHLPAALDIFRAWGARYQCLLTWLKPTGMTPYSWMYDTEHILFGRIGNLPLNQNGLRLSFSAPVTKHSEKPDLFYERTALASPAPRLDMFARRERPGFDPWGNQVERLETRQAVG